MKNIHIESKSVELPQKMPAAAVSPVEAQSSVGSKFDVLSKIVLRYLYSTVSTFLPWVVVTAAAASPSAYWKKSPPSLWSSPCLTPGLIYHTTPHTHAALSCGNVRGLRAGTGELSHLLTLPDDSLDVTSR